MEWPLKIQIDPKGYFGNPEGNVHRMGHEHGEQEIIATLTPACSVAELDGAVSSYGQCRPGPLNNVLHKLDA